MRMGIAFLGLLALAGCAVMVPRTPSAQEQFYARLRALCGQSFEGRVVTTDNADSEMASQRLVIQVRQCSDGELRIPFHVGANHGRTWVIRPTAAGLMLRHAHRDADGAVHQPDDYGGETVAPGTPRRQEFPANQYSRDLFIRENTPQSITNVWAIEIVPGQMLAYELRRPGRNFRAEFDLSRPVATPPPPWGDR